MSFWTYIDGTITVEPMGRTQAEKRYILETVLNHLPLVTGSEKDMNVYIIQKNGTNSSSSCDEYGEHTNNLVNWYGCHDYEEGWLRIQREYILVVNGSFRDREFNETFREFMNWLCRLAKRVSINNILVRIQGWDKQYVINDNCNWNSPYSQMEEYPSWCEESNGEPCWAEHLMWDRAKDSEYPMLLAYKYFADPENDAEVERRREFQNK
jgi:hypothetical protein